LKKRTKKLLFYGSEKTRVAAYAPPSLLSKVFCFFFSKKKYFLASLASGRRA
jgi:hypothetical protein